MEKEFELKLSTAELNLVLSSLAKQPYEAVNFLIEKIVVEARKQSASQPE